MYNTVQLYCTATALTVEQMSGSNYRTFLSPGVDHVTTVDLACDTFQAAPLGNQVGNYGIHAVRTAASSTSPLTDPDPQYPPVRPSSITSSALTFPHPDSILQQCHEKNARIQCTANLSHRASRIARFRIKYVLHPTPTAPQQTLITPTPQYLPTQYQSRQKSNQYHPATSLPRIALHTPTSQPLETILKSPNPISKPYVLATRQPAPMSPPELSPSMPSLSSTPCPVPTFPHPQSSDIPHISAYPSSSASANTRLTMTVFSPSPLYAAPI